MPMPFEWMTDPTAWLGLATLIVLEIVLGIDNLVFIAILADKLPAHQRNRARMIGLTLALLMRLGLLASIAWVVTLTAPLFTVWGAQISGRDLILILGGLFLLFKGTMELHERVEGSAHAGGGGRTQYAAFWQVIVQIVALDAVFSLDSVITAVGMVQDLSIMMTAVVVAMIVMMVASRPLMAFVARHPTVVILCLGLLLMIGFSLVAEGLGFDVPKGYLYAAIGFSILVEACNQLARRNLARGAHALGRRQRAAHAVLRLLQAGREGRAHPEEVAALVADTGEGPLFAPEESTMIERVLAMGERDVRSIMVPRADMVWLDVRDPRHVVLEKFALGHARLPLCAGDPGNVLGVVHLRDLLPRLSAPGPVDLVDAARPAAYVSENTPIPQLLQQVRDLRQHLLLVVDEHGVCVGLVTPLDVLTAVAGELPDAGDADPPSASRLPDGGWSLDARLAVEEVARLLQAPDLRRDYPDATLAGCLLRASGAIPEEGQGMDWRQWRFEVERRIGPRIERVRATRRVEAPAGEPAGPV
ncbi:TerC family protein [Bordetella bronchiseptica]|uniref:TerC family protein n=1 Tax=Bordetella bronchiseptica TaxID=518 RepID=UPI000B9B7F48|nr:TerC family protein [Bordetella bronchiseptica]AZW44267.1 TerC family protein [Bordetella bronchiseptica]MBN3269672.1 TerC family protein [Bordetella bronchiseptica]